MSNRPSEEEGLRLDEVMASIEAQLLAMKADLEVLGDRVRAGDVGSVRDATRTLSDIRAWLKLALETEEKLHERRKRYRGGGWEIDMDGARDTIGRRLDRLRAAGCPMLVSE